MDFGLCTKGITSESRTLRDFCGSPGFFAPEMLLDESYDGFKADVWSIGCILLEVRRVNIRAKPVNVLTPTPSCFQLVLGNNTFSSDWMVMYELSVLKDHNRFAECVCLVSSLVRKDCVVSASSERSP